MSNDKQTAVEWIAAQIRNYKNPLNMGGVYFVLIHQEMINRFEEQAKQMEKERMIDFAAEISYGIGVSKEEMLNVAEQYYEITYGGNK